MKNSSREVIVNETIKYSELWSLFHVLKLKANIRSIDKQFSDMLLQIGKGEINPFIIPENWVTDDVCLSIYKNINSEISKNNVVLSSHNEHIDKLNSKV